MLEGSSPLARGLRWAFGAFLLSPRIIPARAGFTTPHQSADASPQDHPRSRGVYVYVVFDAICYLGSSPLARGLRPHIQAFGDGERIIPARAGFTGWAPRTGAGGSDHPRSRGVYGLRLLPCHVGPGSSPLARGLREGEDARGGGDGIIPARAGFTSVSCTPKNHFGDHPRSRGVYPGRPLMISPFSGSSPLARGLRRRRP